MEPGLQGHPRALAAVFVRFVVDVVEVLLAGEGVALGVPEREGEVVAPSLRLSIPLRGIAGATQHLEIAPGESQVRMVDPGENVTHRGLVFAPKNGIAAAADEALVFDDRIAQALPFGAGIEGFGFLDTPAPFGNEPREPATYENQALRQLPCGHPFGQGKQSQQAHRQSQEEIRPSDVGVQIKNIERNRAPRQQRHGGHRDPTRHAMTDAVGDLLLRGAHQPPHNVPLSSLRRPPPTPLSIAVAAPLLMREGPIVATPAAHWAGSVRRRVPEASHLIVPSYPRVVRPSSLADERHAGASGFCAASCGLPDRQ